MDREKLKTTVRARVQVTLEVECHSAWGGDCNLNQVRRQATDEAIGLVTQNRKLEMTRQVTIIGDPKVTAVLVESE